MDTASRKYASFGLVTAALWIVPIPVRAQWTVTMRAMQNPLPVGQCTGIEVTIVDERGFPPVRPDKKQVSGWDFDLEFLASSPDAFAWRDERHLFLCARAATAASAIVVARYPARHLNPMEQVPGLNLERSIEVQMQGVPAGPSSVASATAVPVGVTPPAQPSPAYAPGPVAGPTGALPPQDPATGYAGGATGYSPPAYPAGASPTYPQSPNPGGGSAPIAGGTYPPQPAGYDPGTVATAVPGSPSPYGQTSPAQPAPGYPAPANPAYQSASPGGVTPPMQPQPTAQAQPTVQAQAAAPPVRSLKQLFQRISGQAKQTVKDVTGQTMDYTANAANSVVGKALSPGGEVAKSNVQDLKDIAAALASGRVVLTQIRFQEHTATLDPSNGPLLVQLAQALLATPGQYLIEGHVDRTEGNQAQVLSEQRAATVKNALVSSGVPPMQLVSAGYGATRPLTTGSSARIEIARTQ